MNHYNYDIALSFAGEDREYVEACAEILRALGFNIFYDNYEQDTLLGKDLYSFLADIYKNRSKFAAIFISKDYVSKRWTKHELKFINAREFEQDEEYLLPIRMDDTVVPEISPTIGYIYASTPLETAKIVAKKLNPKFDIDLMIDELRFHLPDYSIYIEKSDVVFDCKSEDFFAKYPIGFLMELYRQGLVLDAFILPAIVPN